MTTGERMRATRKARGLSAEHVATALGVSPATIYRYENGDIEKVPGDLLEPLASALGTTPAYLMGWEEETYSALLDAAKEMYRDRETVQLTDEEQELINGFRNLNRDGQLALMNTVRGWLSAGLYIKRNVSRLEDA